MSDFVQIIEEITGKSAIIQETAAPASDPSVTYADITLARKTFGYDPQVSIADGLQKFWEWFRNSQIVK
jgi:nucleoside-diphosphate-sugar epimerase